MRGFEPTLLGLLMASSMAFDVAFADGSTLSRASAKPESRCAAGETAAFRANFASWSTGSPLLVRDGSSDGSSVSKMVSEFENPSGKQEYDDKLQALLASNQTGGSPQLARSGTSAEKLVLDRTTSMRDRVLSTDGLRT